jgi:hypothetical protein
MSKQSDTSCSVCGAPTIVTNGGFRALPPLRIARRYADAELNGKATNAEVAWLYAYPLMWVRALQEIRHDIENHIGKQKLDLEPLKPELGRAPSAEFLKARRAVADQTMRRLHFLRIVDRRRAEVESLIGSDAIDRITAGELVTLFTRIAQMAEDDEMQSVIDMARHWAHKLNPGTPTSGGRP